MPTDLAEAVRRTPDLALEAVLAAVLACTDADDFRRRLREAATLVR